MKTLVDQINTGSIEQSRGIGQVARSIHQMEVVTQGNAASAEQSAAAAEQLTAQSESVKEIVSSLNALVGVDTGQSGLSGLARRRPSPATAPGKTKVFASFKSSVKPRPALAQSARPVVATPPSHDAEASFQEF
jgi:hypothetical protein